MLINAKRVLLQKPANNVKLTQCNFCPSPPSMCVGAISTWNLTLRENMDVPPERRYSARNDVGDMTLCDRSDVCNRPDRTVFKYFLRFLLRARLHQASASTLRQLFDDTSCSHWKQWSCSRLGCNPFSSDSIAFNENSTASIITELSQRWRGRLV